MIRVQQIPSKVESAKALVPFVERALGEMETIISINEASTGKKIADLNVLIDSLANEVARLILPSAPLSSPVSGHVYYDDATDTLFTYNEATSAYTAH